MSHIGDEIPELRIAQLDDVQRVIKTLPYREREVFKLLTGAGDGYRYTTEEVAHIFRRSPTSIRQIHREAKRKFLERIAEFLPESRVEPITVTSILEQSRELTPFLISHLKNSPEDLLHLPWQVFEHLVAEFFKQWGYDEVRLVGRSGRTAADVFALRRIDATGNEVRFFIETKRWKKRVGVEVVDRVYGAMLAEKTTFGWHMGMIVTVRGFTQMEKYTPEQLRLMGITLRDGNDIRDWLKNYRFARGGLWLPSPSRELPV